MRRRINVNDVCESRRWCWYCLPLATMLGDCMHHVRHGCCYVAFESNMTNSMLLDGWCRISEYAISSIYIHLHVSFCAASSEIICSCKPLYVIIRVRVNR